MSETYESLQISPKKKRCPPVPDDDDNIITPKKVRARPLTPVSSRQHSTPVALPSHLLKLQTIQNSLHHALAHALATSAVSPTSDTGIVPNVLNHYNLTTAAGLGTNCTLEELKQLCWLWEWDGETLPDKGKDDDDDNPFIDKEKPEIPKQWTRGSMGLIITPTSFLSKSSGKRVPSYGIGIEVEIDIDKNMRGGMAAVARWTADSERRMKDLRVKISRWSQLYEKKSIIPSVPVADLPPLGNPTNKQSSLTQRLASLSPKSPKSMTSSSAIPLQTPPSPSRSFPAKSRITPTKLISKDLKASFPLTPLSVHRTKSSIPFPETPTTNRKSVNYSSDTVSAFDNLDFRPETPTRQTGSEAETVPPTPSTSRRAALYERIRKRSESQPSTPSKKAKIAAMGGMTKDQLLKLGQEDMRRRCLLGRLGGVAESIWMLFSTPATTSSSSPTKRKRRTLPASEVMQAIVQSSPVPISVAEAHESIDLLISLCPFFLKSIEIGTEEWLEMPASNILGSPEKASVQEPDAAELKTLSPKRVKKEAQGLREVREKIKRELEADL